VRYALIFLIALPVAAQNVFPRFTLTGAAYRGDFSTDIRADDNALAGTEINAERDLGLTRAEGLKRFAVSWRPLDRHEISASYFKSSRSGLRQINVPITFNGFVYAVQAEVTTDVSLKCWDATYTGWLRRTDTSGFGINLGVAGLSVDANLLARRPGQTLTVTETASTDVPVALIGAQARSAIGTHLIGAISGGVLPRVHIDTYSGRALTGNASLEYRIVRNIGIGVAYNYFRISGDVADPQFSGDLDMTIKGAELFARLAF
jgi:hypothetical protein